MEVVDLPTPVPGPKQADLHRDGRYALHSFPCEDNEDAFYCTGAPACGPPFPPHRDAGTSRHNGGTWPLVQGFVK